MQDDFQCLVAQIRAGDRDAATLVVERYSGRLKALASRHLDRRMRPKVDPEDVVQSVFQSFFDRCRSDDIEFTGWDNLWAFLAVIAMRRCAWESRWHRAARRDVRREIPDLTPQAEQHWLESFATRDESPETALQLADTFSRVMVHLDDADRDVLRLALQGWTVGEISLELRRHPRAVYRVLQNLRQKLVEQDSQILSVRR